MATTLADRLRAARHSNFVGRGEQLELFRSAATSNELPFHILYVFGPGGVGKSSLLREMQYICERESIQKFTLDGRNIEPTPDHFLQELNNSFGFPFDGTVFQVLVDFESTCVIFIDTYELLSPLDNWLRSTFLPQIPQNVFIVIAGQLPPSAIWRADPGWQSLMQIIPLRNLSPDESRRYLNIRDVPDMDYQRILGFTHGHPLALSLVADSFAQRTDSQFEPEYSPDIIRALVDNFVQKVPSPAHRAALEACALTSITTEVLLAEMMDMPDVHDLFAWLQALSFIQFHRTGIYPHDLAREALLKDLRWRNPVWYSELHRRARNYYTDLFRDVSGEEQQRALFDLVYLHRENPMVRPFFEWQLHGSIVTDRTYMSDLPLLQTMVEEHEGKESAMIAGHWLSRKPEHAVVWRDAHQQPIGFMLSLPIQDLDQEEESDDPAVRSTTAYLKKNAPLRQGETATLFRFWMSKDTYQGVSPIQSLTFIQAVRHYLATPGLAYTFFPTAEPEFWTQVFAYADLARIPEADFEVGGRSYGVYGHDWRLVPPMSWLALLAERETGITQETESDTPATPMIVLSQEEFADALRSMLRYLNQTDMLLDNPILHSRFITNRTGQQATNLERAEALQTIVHEVLEQLSNSTRQVKFYRALYHTYVQPAPTQEKAAEVLDLPFSTYRRHLRSGVDWITDHLWRLETLSM